jgi:iron-sulfur cluster repair protein YtfE (RIC family)
MTAPSRRHDSLIPLSRDHQYALLLCLRIHRGLPEHGDDLDWLKTKAANTVRFFDEDLTIHFQAEEQVLFPAMSRFSGAREIVEDLLREHGTLKRLVDQLRRSESGSCTSTLKQFADTLEAHIRKEERALFPIYEQQASAEVIAAVEQGILSLIGSASEPKHPELLK